MKPHRKEEKRLHAEGYRHVAGIDEAGRGAWAGPLVAAAVILPEQFSVSIPGDSKQIRPSLREELFVAITKQALAWAVSVVDHEIIDRDGVHVANRFALADAASRLAIPADYLLVDGFPIRSMTPHHAIVRGDEMVQSIAAASIIAKVVRDSLMMDFDRLFPSYGFTSHKGYGTEAHIIAVHEHGLSPIHRLSFGFSPREYLRQHSLHTGDMV